MPRDRDEISWPEQSDCAGCGRALEVVGAECSACFAAAGPSPPAGVFRQIELRLRRARGRILIGLFWLGFPLFWAVTASHAALRLYDRYGLEDPRLRGRILRHLAWSVLSVILGLAWFSFWIFHQPAAATARSAGVLPALW